MPLINFEGTLDLKWSENCVCFEEERVKTFATTSAKIKIRI